MLKGKIVDLELVEKGDLQVLRDWDNDVDFVGEFEPFSQSSLSDLQKQFDEKGESAWWFMRRKDGMPVGYAANWKAGGGIGIGYMLVPEERSKGLGSEAVQILVDYVFLHKDVVRIQAETHPDNFASQRVLEKAGFQKEGIRRKAFFSRGVHRDTAMWSLLREEWKGPRVLPKGYVKD
jgi:RimJ/RimL family protein N-acetyltransferase